MFITPAIFQKSYEDVVATLFLFEGLCDRVQIDICDGVVGMEKTWLPYKEKDLPHGFAYEFDLMVSDWRKFVPRVIALGASRVVLHVDGWGRSDIDDALSLLSPHKVSLGLCVSNDTNVPAFAALVRSIEREYSRVFIQVMGITRIGIQGQPFDTGVPKRVEYLREACKGIPIQVDGSMNQETMLIVKNRGASCAVVGSSLYRHGDSHEDVKNKYDVLAKSLG